MHKVCIWLKILKIKRYDEEIVVSLFLAIFQIWRHNKKAKIEKKNIFYKLKNSKLQNIITVISIFEVKKIHKQY